MSPPRLNPTCRGRRRYAFTLIELLAVIVILALVSGVVLAGLSAADDDSALRSAVASWRDLDQRARLAARTLPAGQAFLRLEDDGTLVLIGTSTDEQPLSSVRMPRGLIVRLVTPAPSDQIMFDRLGRSVDYTLELRSRRAPLQLQVCGLTGYIQEPVS